MKSLTSQQKSDIQTLENFLNDPAWMELYGYNTFTTVEVAKLYEHLNANKKGNLHREALAKEALSLFPHRSREGGGNRLLVGSLVTGVLFIIGGVGAFMVWG
jgi:hypothetical protein